MVRPNTTFRRAPTRAHPRTTTLGWSEPAEFSGLPVAQIGNFGPEHSTENDLRRALLANGHRVFAVQENDPDGWAALGQAKAGDFAFVLWTRTWHLPDIPQMAVMAHLRAVGIPTVAYHLDRWWGLDREHQVRDEPMFACDLVCTADGGHDEKWREAGVNHVWFPPGISAANVGRGRPQARYTHDVGFVGSWRPGGYHKEWTHRAELIDWLRRTYRGRLGLYPQGNVAVRGQDLKDLLASCKVAVGDSCLVGGASFYSSDRVPEHLGRGAYLLHPHVEGITDGGMYEAGKHLDCWQVGDWQTLGDMIERALADPGYRAQTSDAGMAHTASEHVYERRMAQLVDLLRERGLLRG